MVQNYGEFSVSLTEIVLSLEDGDSETVRVYNGGEWKATADQPWVIIEPDLEAGTFLVKAQPGYINDAESRMAVITVTSSSDEELEIDVNQRFRLNGYYKGARMARFMLTAISDNGRYVVGEAGMDKRMLWDIETNVFIKEEEAAGIEPWRDVDDAGTPYPIATTTPDGKIQVTYRYTTTTSPSGQQQENIIPVVVIDGQAKDLPCPDVLLKAHDYFGYIVASAISADGNTIFGRTESNYARSLSILWIRNSSGEYEYSWFGEDVTNFLYSGNIYQGDYIDFLEPFRYAGAISPNGKYVCGNHNHTDILPTPPYYKQVTRPFIYNIETKELKIFEEIEDARTYHVTNDGVAFICSPYVGNLRECQVYDKGVLSPLSDWLLQNFGLEDVPNGITVRGVSADGNTIVGDTYENGAYQGVVIRKPVTEE